MADIEIAIKAKNEASAAINQASADLATLGKTASTTTITGIQQTTATINTMTEGLQAATREAQAYNKAVSAPTRIQNAGGAEAIAAGIQQARVELTGLLKDYGQLAKSGTLEFGEGTAANLAKATGEINKQLAALGELDRASKAAAKAGVLGDGATISSQVAQITTSTQRLSAGLKGVEAQSRQAAAAVKSAFAETKTQLSGVDRAFGSISSLLSGGGLGILAGAGLGATALALQQVGASIEEAVVAADRLNKLRTSFDNLAKSAGTSGDAMLKSMRAASAGMVSDADLILAANKAMLLGVADSGQEIAALMDIARVRGQAMGLDLSTAFNDIVTGLGRGSALILDNLGITVDATAANEEYARSIGVVSEKLTEQQRKQALINAVIKQSADLQATPPSGTGAALAQARIAEEQAQIATGQFFAPLIRNIAQGKTDIINLLQGTRNEVDVALREINDLIADRGGVTFSGTQFQIDDLQLGSFQALSSAITQANQAFAAGIPNASQYQQALVNIATEVRTTGIVTLQQANTVQLIVNGLAAESAAYDRLGQSIASTVPLFGDSAKAVRAVATEAERTAAAANLAKYSMDVFAAAMVGANAQAGALAAGLSLVQAQAGATAGVIYDLRDAQNALSAVSNANLAKPDALDSVIPQINNLASSFVGVGFSPQQAIDRVNELKIAAADVTREMQAQGATDEEINLALRENVRQTQEWVSETDRLNKQGLEETKKQYDEIRDKVGGVISESTKLPTFKASDLFSADELKAKGLTGDSQIDVDQAANGGIRPDAINENARRLMAIAVEGLQGQPWLEEFKREVPEVFKELENNPDIRGSALRILQEFENGMRPELLDRGAIKDRVKQMILGEQNAAALAEEIAREIAGELGISLQQAMSATSTALGIDTGEGAGGSNVAAPDMTPQGTLAGESLRAGMIAGFDASGMTVAIVAKIDAEFSNPKSIEAIKKSGGSIGAVWGSGFLSTVGQNVPPGLYDVLVSGLVPLIIAAIGAQSTRTGAQP